MEKNQPWYVYIVQCSDGSLYTGITTNIKRRIIEHNTNQAKGAKSLRGKRPVKLVYSEKHHIHESAAKRERAIKNWRRVYKLKLIQKSNERKNTGFIL